MKSRDLQARVSETQGLLDAAHLAVAAAEEKAAEAEARAEADLARLEEAKARHPPLRRKKYVCML